jgi:hypothetical protein
MESTKWTKASRPAYLQVDNNLKNLTKVDLLKNKLWLIFPKINYTQSYFNYYSRNKNPKKVEPGSQARYVTKLTLEIGITQFQNTKLKSCIFEQKGARSTPPIPPAFYRGQTFKHASIHCPQPRHAPHQSSIEYQKQTCSDIWTNIYFIKG